MRAAFVTGAGSGIGLSLAEQLAARGVTVTLADIGEGVFAAAERLPGARAVQVDVSDREALAAAIGDCADRAGRLDYLFNNAGIGLAAEVQDHTPEHWRAVIDVNLFGVVHGIDAAYPRMVAQGFGHIINTASVAGLVPLPGEAAYVASKHAVVGLSQVLRAEAADHGVSVSVVCPGVVRTPIYDNNPIIGFDRDALLSMLPRGVSADACAARILRGVDRGEGTIVITPLAHAMWRLQRSVPWLFGRASVHYMRRIRRTREA